MKRFWKEMFWVLVALALTFGPPVAFGLDYDPVMVGWGRQVQYSSATMYASSHSVSGLMLGFSLEARGGAVSFQVKVATGSGSGYELHVSSTITVPGGQAVSERFWAPAWNPTILTTSIASGATAQVDISYLTHRTPASGAGSTKVSPQW